MCSCGWLQQGHCCGMPVILGCHCLHPRFPSSRLCPLEACSPHRGNDVWPTAGGAGSRPSRALVELLPCPCRHPVDAKHASCRCLRPNQCAAGWHHNRAMSMAAAAVLASASSCCYTHGGAGVRLQTPATGNEPIRLQPACASSADTSFYPGCKPAKPTRVHAYKKAGRRAARTSFRM